MHHRRGRACDEGTCSDIDRRCPRRVKSERIETCQAAMTFGWLTEQGPSQAVAECQIRRYARLILREEFKLILRNIRGERFLCLSEDYSNDRKKLSRHFL